MVSHGAGRNEHRLRQRAWVSDHCFLATGSQREITFLLLHWWLAAVSVALKAPLLTHLH